MQNLEPGKLIIFSAPSGAGKTTIVKALIDKFPRLEFSISATSRPPRGNERQGRDYYFYTPEEFDRVVAEDLFVEWEEVYAGVKYGTLRSEVERIWARGNVILFDVDVKGGLHLKSIFGDRALAIFVMPPSVGELRSRLVCRNTEAPEVIEKRISKAEHELSFANMFDKIVVNDNLQKAIDEVEELILDFIS